VLITRSFMNFNKKIDFTESQQLVLWKYSRFRFRYFRYLLVFKYCEFCILDHEVGIQTRCNILRKSTISDDNSSKPYAPNRNERNKKYTHTHTHTHTKTFTIYSTLQWAFLWKIQHKFYKLQILNISIQS